MTSIRGHFTAMKSVCKRCMDRFRVPLDCSNPNAGYREPVSWNEQDDENWEHGMVQCPQTSRMGKPQRQFCLCSDEVDAMKQGLLFVWDEKEQV